MKTTVIKRTMKSNRCFLPALILAGVLCGCSTTRQPLVIVRDHQKEAQPELPVRFAGYRQLYEFMAKREGVTFFPDAVFKLAADSETKIYAMDKPLTYVWVITPHFYNGGVFDEIRGAQSNGSIYLVRPLARDFTHGDTDCGFELIGVAAGNAYRFSSVNQIPRLITNWHISAGEHPETVYEWNGNCFRQLAPDKSDLNR